MKINDFLFQIKKTPFYFFFQKIIHHRLYPYIALLILLWFILKNKFIIFLFFLAMMFVLVILWAVILMLIERKDSVNRTHLKILDSIPSDLETINMTEKGSEVQCSHCGEWLDQHQDFVVYEKTGEIVCLECENQN